MTRTMEDFKDAMTMTNSGAEVPKYKNRLQGKESSEAAREVRKECQKGYEIMCQIQDMQFYWVV